MTLSLLEPMNLVVLFFSNIFGLFSLQLKGIRPVDNDILIAKLRPGQVSASWQKS